jgi:hypothetical protein
MKKMPDNEEFCKRAVEIVLSAMELVLNNLTCRRASPLPGLVKSIPSQEFRFPGI